MMLSLTESEIIRALSKEMYISQIAWKTGSHYNYVHRLVYRLNRQRIVKLRKIGRGSTRRTFVSLTVRGKHLRKGIMRRERI